MSELNKLIERLYKVKLNTPKPKMPGRYSTLPDFLITIMIPNYILGHSAAELLYPMSNIVTLKNEAF